MACAGPGHWRPSFGWPVSDRSTDLQTGQRPAWPLRNTGGKTLPISLDYMLPCMLLHARTRDLQSCRRQAPGGMRQVAYGGQFLEGGVWRVACDGLRMVAEIMTSVDIIV